MPKCSYRGCNRKAEYRSADKKQKLICRFHAIDYFKSGGEAFLPRIEKRMKGG